MDLPAKIEKIQKLPVPDISRFKDPSNYHISGDTSICNLLPMQDYHDFSKVESKAESTFLLQK